MSGVTGVIPSSAGAAAYRCSPALRAYQDAFARRLGVRHAFGFWKGRVALYAALKALGVGPGDEVIIPGYTCVMAVNPIMYLGARPVFVDIEPDTFNLDPRLVEAAVTPRTRVIIAQHTYGYPADLDAIGAIAARHGLTLIEDCCLAQGSTWRGRAVGTFGTAAYFSSQWNKPYTTGLGGLLTTSDEGLAERVDRLCAAELRPPSARRVQMLRAQLAVYRALIYPRTTALAQNLFRLLTRTGLVVGSSSNAEFTPVMEEGFFTGMSDVQARSGLRQLARLEAGNEHRRRLARLYDELLAAKGFPPRQMPAGADPVLVRYPLRVKDKAAALAGAAKHFVELGSWFECPLHPIETKLEDFGYTPGLCPEAERASHEVINLPLHPRANETTVRRTVEYVGRFGAGVA